ncbi:hypothetical protein ACFL1X_04850 [Candidatus Hydrogenedentota bacterium]
MKDEDTKQEQVDVEEGLYDVNEEEEAQEGFGLTTILGLLFIGFIILPGAIYLALVTGTNIGPAAEWVTVILFAELARRSFKKLRKQQIFILFYAAGGLMIMIGGLHIMGGPFGSLIWNQFVGTSDEAHLFEIADDLAEPGNEWIAPFASTAIKTRDMLSPAWIPAILVVFATFSLIHVNRYCMGFILFKLTSDYEKLPFPMAEIGAAGSIAIAESFEKKDSPLWRIFSIGMTIGMAFGAVYIIIPTVSGTFLPRPAQLLPIPWVDFSPQFTRDYPAVLLGVNTDLSAILIGMLLPFPLVCAQFVSSMTCHTIVNPILHKAGVLSTWRPGMGSIPTSVSNNLDFWLSFGIGVAIVVLVVGIIHMLWTTLTRQHSDEKEPRTPWYERLLKFIILAVGATALYALPFRTALLLIGVATVVLFILALLREKIRLRGSGRSENVKIRKPTTRKGDIPVWLAIVMVFLTSLGFVILVKFLVPTFPWWIVAFFAFIWTPFFSYIQARMIGITGRPLGFPYMREGSIFLSGYRGVGAWFAPLPLFNHGGYAQVFKVAELTKTKFTSMLKAEILMIPVALICSLFFWAFLWKLQPIPSSAYPFAAKIWPNLALYQCLWASSTAGIDGEETLNKIREFEEENGADRAQIILTSADGEDVTDLLVTLEGKYDAHFVKPADPDSYAEELNKQGFTKAGISKTRVLIIDEKKNDSESFEDYFEDYKTCEVADSGQSALRLIGTHVFGGELEGKRPYDLILINGTMPRGPTFMLDAIKVWKIRWGAIVSGIMVGIVTIFKLPMVLFYGSVAGLGMWGWPHASIPMFCGALLGRYFFARKYGKKKWRRYIPVIVAGYTCGMGLMGMLAAAIAMISKAVVQLPY